jgi:uncharacterized protein YajQ (UPF0234 family)
MPSFDVSSEVNMANLTNSIDVASRTIINRYDFKGTTAKVELDQIKDILLPAMEKKEADSSKRIEPQDIQTVSGNKVKQLLKLKSGIDTELAKKIVKLLKDSGLKVQSAIQGESVRVSGAKRDNLQDAIAFIKKSITDFPLEFGNFRD